MARTKSKAKKISNKIRLPKQLIQLPALKFIPLPCMSNLGKVKLWLKSTPCNRSRPLELNRCIQRLQSYLQPLRFRPMINGLMHLIGALSKSKKMLITGLIIHARWGSELSPFKYASNSISNYGTMRAELTSVSSPALMVYCFNEHDERAWIRHECNVIDPFDAKRRRMQFTRVIIGSDDKIYALSLQGALAVMEDVDSRLVITEVSSTRGVPYVSSKYFKEYFVELNREILLVFLICKRSLEFVDEVEIFRLCFDRLKWIKVEKLDGEALFLDRCGIWANSKEVGCKKNCVYFTHGANNGWWVYDIESCCI